MLQRGVGDAIFRSPFDQPTGVTDNPSTCRGLRQSRFFLTDSQLIEVIDASVQNLEHRSPTKTSTPHRATHADGVAPDGCSDASARQRTASRIRRTPPNSSALATARGLAEALTNVKDVRSTSRTKFPRGDARVATACITCIPKVLTETSF